MLGVLKAMEFRTITMHGQSARPRHFGLDYGYESRKLVPTDPMPSDLAWCSSGPRRWPASTRPQSSREAGLSAEDSSQAAGLMTAAEFKGWMVQCLA